MDARHRGAGGVRRSWLPGLLIVCLVGVVLPGIVGSPALAQPREPIVLGRSAINDVAIAPDGDWIGVASSRGVEVYHQTATPSKQPDSQKLIAALTLGVAIGQPHGKPRWLATGGSDGLVRLWVLEDGKLADRGAWTSPDLGGAWVRTLAASPDGTHLVAGLDNGHVLIWSVEAQTGGALNVTPLRSVEQHTGRVRAIGFAPSEGGPLQFAVGSDDGHVTIVTIAEGAVIAGPRQEIGADDWVRGVAFDGPSTIVTATRKGNVTRWTVGEGGTLQAAATLEGASAVEATSVAAAGGVTVVGFGDGTIKAWQGETPAGSPQKHQAWVRRVALAANGQLVSASDDTQVRIGPVTGDRRDLATYTSPVKAVAVLPSDAPGGPPRVVAGSSDGQARVWNGEVLERVLGDPNFDAAVLSVAVAPDQTIAAGGRDMLVRLWDRGAQGPPSLTLPGHQDWVSQVTFAPGEGGSRLLASASYDGSAHLRRLTNRWTDPTAFPVPADRPDNFVRGVALTNDRVLPLITASRYDGIRRWSDREGEGSEQLTADGAGGFSANGVAATPDGRWVVGGYGQSGPDGAAGLVVVWHCTDACTPVPLPDQDQPADQVWSVAVVQLAGGTDFLVAAGGADRQVHVWRVRENGPVTRVKTFDGHTDWVRSVAFSSDGAWVVSGAEDGTIRLWPIT